MVYSEPDKKGRRVWQTLELAAIFFFQQVSKLFPLTPHRTERGKGRCQILSERAVHLESLTTDSAGTKGSKCPGSLLNLFRCVDFFYWGRKEKKEQQHLSSNLESSTHTHTHAHILHEWVMDLTHQRERESTCSAFTWYSTPAQHFFLPCSIFLSVRKSRVTAIQYDDWDDDMSFVPNYSSKQKGFYFRSRSLCLMHARTQARGMA